jgi:methylthioribose-1-phosphate isomerase
LSRFNFHTIRWIGDGIEILDQRLLPHKVIYLILREPEEVFTAIQELAVRGAPAIGVAAAMGIALGAQKITAQKRADFLIHLKGIVDFLASSRPTAKNLFWALERMYSVAENAGKSPQEIKNALSEEAEKIYWEDIETNERMGELGQTLLTSGDAVLTHCNAGSLATAGFGTALGVIRAAVRNGKKITVIATETRPLLQGSRLTTWELMADGIDVTLITDAMAGHFFKEGMIQKVITGADRITRNGDVANKIGTYTHAVLAQEHGVPFFVAAPLSTIDMSLESERDIPIEERNPDEVRTVMGKPISPAGVAVLNPAFDVTPHRYISALITERGVLTPPYDEALNKIHSTG